MNSKNSVRWDSPHAVLGSKEHSEYLRKRFTETKLIRYHVMIVTMETAKIFAEELELME